MASLKTLLFGKDKRIARRLIVLIVAFSALVTLLVSAVQLVFVYRELRDNMEQSLERVEIFVPGLSGNVWNFDEEQIHLALNALLQLPTIDQVSLSTADMEQTWSSGKSLASRVVTRSYSLRQNVRGTDTEIATLEVVANLDTIYHQVAARAVSIALSNALQMFLVALFMVFLLRRLLISRLERLARKVSELGPKLYPLESSLQESEPTPSHLDELDAVDLALRNTTRNLKRAEQRLRLAATAFEAQVGIEVADPAGVLLQVNRRFSEITGYSAEEAVGQNASFLVSGRHDADFFTSMFDSVRATGSWQGEIRSRRKNGEIYPEFLTITSVAGEDGKITNYVGTRIDISDRVLAEQRVHASLREKEVLLKEIYHRVKNNLQVVASLLYLQGRGMADPEMKALLAETANRVKAMAMVHEQLYRSKDLSNIALEDYLAQLANQLRQVHEPLSTRVPLQLEVEKTILGIDTAIPLGLIINELVSNAYKHGYPQDSAEGHILLRLVQLADGDFHLAVIDDGCGLPEGFDAASLSSLGMQLVVTLAKQLGGTLQYRSEGGHTRFELLFRPEASEAKRLLLQ